MTQRLRWMLGGDVNQGVQPVRHLLDAPNSFGADPMAVFWSTGWSARATSLPMAHADHRVLRVMGGLTTVGVVNATYQWDGDEELLQKVARWADVMLMVECRTRDNKPLPVRQFIGDTHRVRQDTTSAARAGSAIAVRRDPELRVTSTSLSLLSPQGHRVQARHLRTVNVIDHGVATRYGAAHLGLRSTGVQDDGERALQSWVARARRTRPAS